MKICAVICEYNPVHYGHIYHLEASRKLTGCDKILCLMSGNFVQRGEPAVADKHARAKTAVMAGADIVVELPAVFALGNAELFAEGAIRMLNLFGADYLSFGSECGEIDILTQTATILNNESPEFREEIFKHLKSGNNYPKSRELTFNSLYPQLVGILSSPNNILAVEYIRALQRTNSKIIPITVKRAGSGYHDKNISDGYPSSTAVRQTLSGSSQVSAPFAPEDIINTIRNALTPPERTYYGMSALITAHVRNANKSALDEIYDATDDIVSRIINFSSKNADYNALINAVKNKSVTLARIKRFLLCSLLGVTQDTVKGFLEYPNYFNVLGLRGDARGLLKNTSVNMIARFSDYNKIESPHIKKAAAVDENAAAVYSAITGKAIPHFAHKIYVAD